MTLFEAAKSVPALDVAERYANVQAVRRGRRAWCKCVFHRDSDPSLSFEVDGKFAGRFRCFGCNAEGSSVDFVAKWFKETPVEAAKRICSDFGIEYERAGADVRAKAQKKKAVEQLTGEIKEASAFALCVAGGLIKESRDHLSQLDPEDPLFADDRGNLEAIIEDAQAFKTALQTPKDAETAYALLTGEGVKEKLEGQYKRLKKIDEQTGTNYVSWYRRGTL